MAVSSLIQTSTRSHMSFRVYASAMTLGPAVPCLQAYKVALPGNGYLAPIDFASLSHVVVCAIALHMFACCVKATNAISLRSGHCHKIHKQACCQFMQELDEKKHAP